MISVDNGAAEQLRSIGQYLIALADAAALEPPASDAAIPLPLGFEMHANGLSDARLHQLALSAYEQRRQRVAKKHGPEREQRNRGDGDAASDPRVARHGVAFDALAFVNVVDACDEQSTRLKRSVFRIQK